MFRKMRRDDRAKTIEQGEKILQAKTNGVLSVTGDEGWPYGVPVSYVYEDGRIYIHGAMEGHKIDAINKDSRVCFTVVGGDKVLPDKYTTIYSSVICFGRARVCDNRAEKQKALEAVLDKYSSEEFMEGGIEHMWEAFDRCGVIIIDIEHMTVKGK